MMFRDVERSQNSSTPLRSTNNVLRRTVELIASAIGPLATIRAIQSNSHGIINETSCMAINLACSNTTGTKSQALHFPLQGGIQPEQSTSPRPVSETVSASNKKTILLQPSHLTSKENQHNTESMSQIVHSNNDLKKLQSGRISKVNPQPKDESQSLFSFKKKECGVHSHTPCCECDCGHIFTSDIGCDPGTGAAKASGDSHTTSHLKDQPLSTKTSPVVRFGLSQDGVHNTPAVENMPVPHSLCPFAKGNAKLMKPLSTVHHSQYQPSENKNVSASSISKDGAQEVSGGEALMITAAPVSTKISTSAQAVTAESTVPTVSTKSVGTPDGSTGKEQHPDEYQCVTVKAKTHDSVKDKTALNTKNLHKIVAEEIQKRLVQQGQQLVVLPEQGTVSKNCKSENRPLQIFGRAQPVVSVLKAPKSFSRTLILRSQKARPANGAQPTRTSSRIFITPHITLPPGTKKARFVVRVA